MSFNTEISIHYSRQSALLLDKSLSYNQEFVDLAEKLNIYLHFLNLDWTRDLGFTLHNRFFYSPHTVRAPEYSIKALNLCPKHKHNVWLWTGCTLGASLSLSESTFFLQSQKNHPSITAQELISHVEGGNMLSTGDTLIIGSNSAFLGALRLLVDQPPNLCEEVRNTLEIISNRDDWDEAIETAADLLEQHQIESLNRQLSDFTRKAKLESYSIPAVLTALVEFTKVESAAELRRVMGHEQVLWTPNDLGLQARQIHYHLDLYMANIAFNTVILDDPREVISACNDALHQLSQFTPICFEKLEVYKSLVHNVLIDKNIHSQEKLSELYNMAVSSEDPFTKEIATICRSQAIAELFDITLQEDYDEIKKSLDDAGIRVITVPGNWYDLDHKNFTVAHTHCFINGITHQATSSWLTFRYDKQENFRHQAFKDKIAKHVKNTFYIKGGKNELILAGGGLRCMTLPFEINPNYLPQTE